jgi:phosphohistidine phosphatase SixA
VRHAEKASDSGADPQLSPLGYARARELADLLAGERVDQVIATQYRRTQLTVQPLAERLGLPVEVVEATAGEALAERLRGADPGRRFVVAGHSNTVPDLLGWLGVEEVIEIPDEQYGELFVVRLRAGEATLERRRFGF